MSMMIAAFVCIALLAVSLVHFLWAFGSTWPARDVKTLSQTVTGRAGAERMPSRWLSLGVAVLTFAASVWALALADHAGGSALLTAIGVLLGAVFLVRGVVGYTPGWQKITPEEPFRSNDRKVYSPLCLGLGIGFFALVLMRLT